MNKGELETEGRHIDQLSKDEWWTIFKMVSDGESLNAAVRKLAKRHGKTVRKAYHTVRELYGKGITPLSDKEYQQIAERLKYDTEPSYVKNVHFKYLLWHQSKEKEPVLERRSQELVCACLHNPHIEICTEYDWKPLHFCDYDYRLDPITWFRLCTPDFSKDVNEAKLEDEYWKPYFPELKSHLENIGFWDHYQSLYGSVWALQIDYEKAVKELGETNKKFTNAWLNIQKHRNKSAKPSRIPADPTPNIEWFLPRYKPRYSNMMMKIFDQNITDLLGRLCDLESRLQQLNHDLLCP